VRIAKRLVSALQQLSREPITRELQKELVSTTINNKLISHVYVEVLILLRQCASVVALGDNSLESLIQFYHLFWVSNHLDHIRAEHRRVINNVVR
jgi:hypothetical protein